MPTPASDLHDDGLPPWAAELLARPLPVPADELARARARVMAQVRRAPRHGRPLARAYRLGAAVPRWARRRGLLAPGAAFPAGALLAAAVAVVAAGGRLGPGAGLPVRAVLGATAAGATVLGDTVLGDGLLRDTLRVVRFALAGPAVRGATGVALAGDFSGWRAAAPLVRDARSGAWSVTLVVPRDAVRYAFVVDGPHGRRQLPAPPLPAAGRPATAGDST